MSRTLALLGGCFTLVLLVGTPALADDKKESDLSVLVKGNTAFALDMYGQLREGDGNLLFSPYSISTALGMASAGARGETAKEMAKVLHFGLDQQRLHPAFTQLTRELNNHGLPRDYQLNVANSIWGDNSFYPAADFVKVLHTNYGSRQRRVNFQREHDQARQEINRWVESRTNNRIKDLLAKDDVDPMTRMVLVNAIYLKAGWDTAFDKTMTEDGKFEIAPGKTVKVTMMRQAKNCGYHGTRSMQMVEMPFEGGELSFVIVLPKNKQGLAALEKELTPAVLSGWLGNLKQEEVFLTVPRFKIEGRFNLQKKLTNLGMRSAFDPGKANFSGMSDAEKLHISKVIHQAYLNLDEEGTEAAAATAVVMARASDGKHTPPVVQADHPFLFLLRDTRTGSILFMGRVTNPVAVEK